MAFACRSSGASRVRVLQHFLGRQGLAEVVALYFVATALAQKVVLALRFDAFCDGLEAQAAGHADDGQNDGPVIGVRLQVAHKGLINFELANLEALQVAQ